MSENGKWELGERKKGGGGGLYVASGLDRSPGGVGSGAICYIVIYDKR